jgi:hypothetical protein
MENKFKSGQFIISDEFQAEEKAIEDSASIILKVSEKEAIRLNTYYDEAEGITKEQIKSIASILSKAYEEVGDIIAKNDFVYEECEEIVGTAHCEFIAKLSYLQGLVKEA